jgi:hypothetical protein
VIGVAERVDRQKEAGGRREGLDEAAADGRPESADSVTSNADGIRPARLAGRPSRRTSERS